MEDTSEELPEISVILDQEDLWLIEGVKCGLATNGIEWDALEFIRYDDVGSFDKVIIHGVRRRKK